MKILVVSDIHAFKELGNAKQKPSYVEVGSEKCSLLQFKELSKTEPFQDIDLIITPGDLSNRAEPAGTNYVWRMLNEIAERSPNCKILATAGNHDVDSRYQNNTYCPKDALLQLNPEFPCVTNIKCFSHTGDQERQLWFWARNYYIYSHPKCRIICLNSTAYHGQGRDDEFEHGRISSFTLESIKQSIQRDASIRLEAGVKPPDINLFLCHHHLQKEGGIDDPDESAMIGAHALSAFLETGDYGRWMVIHGHRHVGRLYQSGGTGGPYIFSSASFGAKPNEEVYNFSNQAHIIELDFESMKQHNLFPAGKISSWTWIRGGLGWVQMKSKAPGMPPITQFGFRGNIDDFAKKIGDLCLELDGIKWEAVLSKFPELIFLDYVQCDILNKTLQRDRKCELKFDSMGVVESVLTGVSGQ